MNARINKKLEKHSELQRKNTLQLRKSRLYIWILSLLSSLLLSIPFLIPGTGIVAFVAFIPLLSAEYIARENNIKYFWIVYYIAFLIWNIATTFWVYIATPPGAIAAFTLNALQMAIIFALFRWMRGLTKGFLPYVFLIITWLAWEHSYFTWHVSWPWLVLGNSFASSIKYIQWYEFTGTLGGSLWILLINTLLYRIIILKIRGDKILVSTIGLAIILFIPLILSLSMYFSYNSKNNNIGSSKQVHFSIIQPNIDPYGDKFGGLSQKQQTSILLDLSQKAINEFKITTFCANSSINDSVSNSINDSNKNFCNNNIITNILLAPETFLAASYDSYSVVNEENPFATPSFVTIYNYMKMLNADSCNTSPYCVDYNMILGAETAKIYLGPFKKDRNNQIIPPTETARMINNGIHFYDKFNSSIFIASNGDCDYYHKSKLVIMAESTPFTGIFKPLRKFAINLGGTFGGFGTQKERTIFTTKDSIKIGTAICYESVYGDYYRDYILKGANIMSIITNDGWWNDTPGHIQHLNYASLRAIETRRSIARCGNTGISALINERGDVLKRSNWWHPEYLNGVLNTNNYITFFVKNGDIVGRISRFLFMLFVLMGIVRQISKKYIVK